MVLGIYSCQILSSLWFFTGWINGFLKFCRASWTHVRWVWFYTWMATFSSITNVKTYMGSSHRAFLAKRASRFSLCFQTALAGCWVLFYQVTNTHWYHLKPMKPFPFTSSLLQGGKLEMRSSCCLKFRKEICPELPQKLLRALSSSERLKQRRMNSVITVKYFKVAKIWKKKCPPWDLQSQKDYQGVLQLEFW